LSLLTAKI